MKKLFLIVLVAMMAIGMCVAQERQSLVSFRFGAGSTFMRTEGEVSGMKTGTGLSFDIDCNPWGGIWFVGFGVNQQTIAINNLLKQDNSPLYDDVNTNFLSGVIRGGLDFPVARKHNIKLALESGIAGIMSRQKYEGNHYRTKNPTVVIGGELSYNYMLTRHLGINVLMRVDRFGNDNLQHGSRPSSSMQPIKFNPLTLGLGLSYHIK